MKKVVTIISSLLIVAGLKGQKTTVQKETIKPTDTIVNKNIQVSTNTSTQAIKKTQKDVKLAPAMKDLKEAPAVKDLKEAPAIKKTAPAVKDFKKTTIEQ